MWAMIEKLRMWAWSMGRYSVEASSRRSPCEAGRTGLAARPADPVMDRRCTAMSQDLCLVPGQLTLPATGTGRPEGRVATVDPQGITAEWTIRRRHKR